jgi:hypothetical protein
LDRSIIGFWHAGESLHTPFLSPYLKALGADFSNGVNFAIGGSTATPGGSPFSLDVQLHQWLYFRARSMEMINLGLSSQLWSSLAFVK